ncbi:MAG: transglutaminase domain-containing protein [Geminicoccaceae bacterium]
MADGGSAPLSYRIRHRTLYSYSAPVSISHHLLHLDPRSTDHQTVTRLGLEISPKVERTSRDLDAFGNTIRSLTIDAAHKALELTMQARVRLHPPVIPLPAATPAFETVAAETADPNDVSMMEAAPFAYPSPMVPTDDRFQDYARASFGPGRPVLEGVLELSRRLHEDLVYDPGATEVTTLPAEAFARRRGVCQDYAHIALACLRSIGLPARYVSGYLRTRRDDEEALVGADASHAWISVWVPGAGWIDVDPTNDVVPAGEHITLAWGRDYTDVSPVAGVVFGGGNHHLDVEVSVTSDDG